MSTLNTDNRHLLGARLREERKKLSMTQDALSAVLGVGRTTVADWEKGRAAPPADALAKSMRLGFDAVYIMSGTRQDTGIKKQLTSKACELVKTYMALPEEDQELALLQVEAMFGKAVRDGRCEYVVERKKEKD